MNFETKILKFPLASELNVKVQSLLNSCFKHETQEVADFEKETHYDSPILYVLAFDGNELIGVTMVFIRPIRVLGEDVRLGGIGGVCTKEEHRNKGIATALIKDGLSELKKLNCDVAYLGTDENLMPLYEAVGFIKLNKQCLVTGKSGKQLLRWGGMLAPINSIEKLNLIVKNSEPFDLQGGEW